MPTGVVTTQYPNYAGAIFMQGNAETPLLSLISANQRLSNSYRFICGQSYALEDATVPHVSEKQSLIAPQPTGVKRVQDYNVTQIFHESVGTSYMREASMGALDGVNNAEQMANPSSEFNLQLTAKTRKIGTDIEKTLIQGRYHEATNENDANQTRGLVEAVRSNVYDVGGRELSIWDIAELLTAIGESGAPKDGLVLWCDAVTMFQLCKEAEAMSIRPVESMVSGISITTLRTPVGTISMHAGRFLPAGTALLLNIGVLAPVGQNTPGKGNFFYEELAKTGAGTTGQIFGLFGLDYGPEWYHGQLTNIKPSFVRPKPGVTVNVGSVVPVVDALPELSEVEIVDTSANGLKFTTKYTGVPVEEPITRFEYLIGNKPISKFELVPVIDASMVGKYVKVRVTAVSNATGTVTSGARKITDAVSRVISVTADETMSATDGNVDVTVTLDRPITGIVEVNAMKDRVILDTRHIYFNECTGGTAHFTLSGLASGDNIEFEAIGQHHIKGIASTSVNVED